MSNIDALPYFDKQVENPGEACSAELTHPTRLLELQADTTLAAAKAAAQALVEAELKSTPKPASDDPRIPAEAEIFSVSVCRS
jgi:pre-mRNA-splicing factor SPF27